MSKNIINIWSAISSVLNGNPTDEETLCVHHWINNDKRNKILFSRIKNTKYNQFIEEKALAAKEYIYIKTQAKINEVNLRFRIRIWRSIAAASIILLILTGGGYLSNTKTYNPVIIESKSPAGSIAHFTLEDGTRIILNASSSISYPANFSKKNRSVKLNGEAYFEVTRDTGRPFVVETNDMKIQVLGTHFNVKSYDCDEKASTTLLEGSVSVEVKQSNASSLNKPVILHPGQQITLDKNTFRTTVNRVNTELYTSWRNGQYFFENEKFIDIIKILERQFGVSITITSPSVKSQLYSGFFGKKEGVLQILDSFKKHRDFDYKQNDNGIEIYEIRKKEK